MTMPRPRVNHPAVIYLWITVRTRIAKVRSGELQRGASAVEWVVISMIVVTIVAAVGLLISKAIRDKAQQVSTCIGTADGTNGC